MPEDIIDCLVTDKQIRPPGNFACVCVPSSLDTVYSLWGRETQVVEKIRNNPDLTPCWINCQFLTTICEARERLPVALKNIQGVNL